MRELKLIGEGSRQEVTGIVTLGDAAKAIELLFDGVVPPDAPFHCYLNGSTFAIWTEIPR